MTDEALDLYEALQAMLDIAPFATDKATKEIHQQAQNALKSYRSARLRDSEPLPNFPSKQSE